MLSLRSVTHGTIVENSTCTRSFSKLDFGADTMTIVPIQEELNVSAIESLVQYNYSRFAMLAVHYLDTSGTQNEKCDIGDIIPLVAQFKMDTYIIQQIRYMKLCHEF